MRCVTALIRVGYERTQGGEPTAAVPCFFNKLTLRGTSRILAGRDIPAWKGQADSSDAVFVLPKHEHLPLDGNCVDQRVVTHASRIEVINDAPIRELHRFPGDLSNRTTGKLHASMERYPRLEGDHESYRIVSFHAD